MPAQILPSRPVEPVEVTFNRIEESLIKFHAEERLGSMDIDNFSEQLLAIKRNYDAMVSTRGRLNVQQELNLRNDLRALNEEIMNQARMN